MSDTAYVILWIIVLLPVLGAIIGLIGMGVGRNFWTWLIYGTLVPVVALPHALYLALGEGKKVCPFCHSSARISARSCTRCGYEFVDLS